MLHINLDLSGLADLQDIGPVAQDEMARAAARLTAATHAKIAELASQKLHTRREQYLNALTYFQVDDHTFVVNLDASARWIDDGMRPHNMLDDLLKSRKAKRAKDGSTYVVVPFQHNKARQQLTPAQQKLLDTIKGELAKVDATPNKIEVDASGNPKTGLVRSLDINGRPRSTRALRIGRGPYGDVAQGPTGIPLLRGVRVYQREFKDKAGDTKVGRFVMTFRVASSKHRSQGGRWDHPGSPPMNLMEEGLSWALNEWDSKIAPSVLAKVVAAIS